MKILRGELRKTRYVIAIIVLVMLLEAYPIIEHTRIIIFYWRNIDTGFIGVGIGEIVAMWILYTSIIPLLYWRLRR